MSEPSLASFLQQLCREVSAAQEAAAAGDLRLRTVRVHVEARRGTEGAIQFVPALQAHPPGGSTPGAAHELTLELGPATPAAAGVAAAPPMAAAVTAPGDEPPSGGDPATMRRRLELVLGGPPGFTTGARAEILVDLLREFGRPALLEALGREWISQFDTGPDASAAVTKPPTPTGGSGGP